MGDLKKDNRARQWVFLVYPDSVLPDWEFRLNQEHVSWCHSPIHDHDFWTDLDESENPEHVAGTLKKAHYHCLIRFEGKQSYDNVLSLLQKCLGCDAINYIVRCFNARAYVRYFAHLDDPDKTPYDISKSYFYACNYEDLVLPSSYEKLEWLKQIQNFCLENDIYEFADISNYALSNNDDWYYLINFVCTQALKSWFSSMRSKLSHRSPDQ